MILQQAAIKREREACAKLAEQHKGSAARRRKERGQRLVSYSPEIQIEINAEERGEDLAAECIARAIRARSEKEKTDD